jgi:hypothetical protein
MEYSNGSSSEKNSPVSSEEVEGKKIAEGNKGKKQPQYKNPTRGSPNLPRRRLQQLRGNMENRARAF